MIAGKPGEIRIPGGYPFLRALISDISNIFCKKLCYEAAE
jgi:hypothetical protein